MLASASGDSLTALYPAVAAIVVAAIGFAGNIVLDRRRSRNATDDDDDTNVISALASALAAETEARKAAEQRALECEAREKAKRR